MKTESCCRQRLALRAARAPPAGGPGALGPARPRGAAAAEGRGAAAGLCPRCPPPGSAAAPPGRRARERPVPRSLGCTPPAAPRRAATAPALRAGTPGPPPHHHHPPFPGQPWSDPRGGEPRRPSGPERTASPGRGAFPAAPRPAVLSSPRGLVATDLRAPKLRGSTPGCRSLYSTEAVTGWGGSPPLFS